MLYVCKFLILSFVLSSCEAETSMGSLPNSEELKFLQSFSKQNFNEILNSVLKSQISNQCRNDLNILGSKLGNPKTGLDDQFWHLKMLDANGEIPSGIFGGNTVSIGSYSSCIAIDFKNQTTQGFRGRYYSAFFNFGQTSQNFRHKSQTWIHPTFLSKKNEKSTMAGISQLSLRLGFCFPSSCSETDLQQGLQTAADDVLKNPGLQSYLSVTVVTFVSQSEADVWHFDGVDIFAIVLTSTIGIFILIGTCLELWWVKYSDSFQHLKKSLAGTFLLGFSAYSNTRTLLSVKSKDQKTNGSYLQCLNGIRFLSMTWVIICHTYGNALTSPNYNALSFGTKLQSVYAFQVVLNGFLSVDSFFVLSGCLVAYVTLNELDKTKGRLNWIVVVVHRYLRLTGIYAFLVLIHSTLLRVLTGGPNDLTVAMVNFCRNTWWRNMLYITIYSYSEAGAADLGCIGQGWYLDDDMQMFLVSPFIIYPLWRWKIPGLIWAILWTIASAVLPMTLTILRDWPATGLLNVNPEADFFRKNYIVPWCRFSPYICGIMLGYALHATKTKKFRMSKELNVLIWIIAFIVGYLVVYGLDIPETLQDFNEHQKIPSTAMNAAYGGFHRLAWGVALSWVIFACCRGYGGWINTFLSWEAFEPLARLSYSIYLVHMTVIFTLIARDDFTVSLTHLEVIVRIMSVMVISTVISAVLFVFFEVPWANTEKLAFSIILPAKTKSKTK